MITHRSHPGLTWAASIIGLAAKHDPRTRQMLTGGMAMHATRRESDLPVMARMYAQIYNAPRPWTSSLARPCEAESFFHINFGVSHSAPFMTRRMVRYILTDWQVVPETVGTAELLASELAANAVRFGSVHPARGSYVPYISLTLWHARESVVIEVSDENEKPPVMQVADQESDSGRGLVIVQALSKEWSYYYPRPGWKTVYCVIDLDLLR
jgi:hypothetical protein